ncbi:unnamed protein product [Prorocentrum cordatum]|uniref:Uncharacterized protein n=1 Tax=Prorocentrum cordatum TaxID=2364126 RepID=A0ABN9RQ30_9DINO|nr:unnamed protein product [Polarella glacialis]
MCDEDIPPVVQARFLPDRGSAAATDVRLGPSFGVSCHQPRGSLQQPLPPEGSQVRAACDLLPAWTPELANARAEGSRVVAERPISREQLLSSGSLVLVDGAAEAYWATEIAGSARIRTALPEHVPPGVESEPLQKAAPTRPTLRTHYAVPAEAPSGFPVEDRTCLPVLTAAATAIAPPVYVGTASAAPEAWPADRHHSSGFPAQGSAPLPERCNSSEFPSQRTVVASYPALPTPLTPSSPPAEPVLGSVTGTPAATDSPGTLAVWNKHIEAVSRLFAESAMAAPPAGPALPGLSPAPLGSAVAPCGAHLAAPLGYVAAPFGIQPPPGTPCGVQPLGSVAAPPGYLAAPFGMQPPLGTPCGAQPLGGAAAPPGSVAAPFGMQPPPGTPCGAPPLGSVAGPCGMPPPGAAAPSVALPWGFAASPAAGWPPGGPPLPGFAAGVPPPPAVHPAGPASIHVLPGIPNAVRSLATRYQGEAPQASFHL